MIIYYLPVKMPSNFGRNKWHIYTSLFLMTDYSDEAAMIELQLSQSLFDNACIILAGKLNCLITEISWGDRSNKRYLQLKCKIGEHEVDHIIEWSPRVDSWRREKFDVIWLMLKESKAHYDKYLELLPEE